LVHELPPEPEPEFVDYEEVLATHNASDIAVVKSILDGEGIAYFFKGEQFVWMRPLIEPALLMVRKDQVKEVEALLKDLKLTYLAISLNKSLKEKEAP
jgi:hypothetical protein